MVTQLSIDFKPSVYAQYSSFREFIADDVVVSICADRKILKKSIAADLDYSPSHLTQKLNGLGDSRFTVDDLEKLGELYGWGDILKYVAYRASKGSNKADLEAQIAALQTQLQAQP